MTNPQQHAHAHHRQVSARFSAAAGTYADVSRMQDQVARRVLDMVPGEFRPHRVLDAGCGTGQLLALAAERWPHARLTGVDAARGMIREAGTRCAAWPNVEFAEADILTFHPPALFDLVLSSSTLHWVRPFEAGMAHVVGLAERGGLVSLAVMLDGSLRELHESRMAVAPGKPPAGRLPSAPQLESALRAIPGIRIRILDKVSSEYELPSATEVLANLHAMGVTGGDLSRSHRPLTRRDIAALASWYDRHYASPRGVSLTYVVGYVLVELD